MPPPADAPALTRTPACDRTGSRRGAVLVAVSAVIVAGVALALMFASAPSGSDALGGDANTGDARLDESVTAPMRIVSTVPSATETLFALGLGDRVVACSAFDVWPADRLAGLPRVGGYDDPNLEALLAARPDLVILQGEHPTVTRFCEQQRIPTLRIAMADVDTVLDDIRSIANGCGVPESGERLAAAIERDLRRVRDAVVARPQVPALLVLWREPGSLRGMGTAAAGTFLDDLLRAAGGQNVFSDGAIDYPAVSYETLIDGAPACILECRAGQAITARDRVRLIEDWQALPGVPAVRDGRVRVLAGDYLMIPGPRMILTVADFARALHEHANATPLALELETPALLDRAVSATSTRE